ncbi:hypothetical protein F5Y09DRAFT_298269, partial [Xylaria sp. FL1042]
MSLVVSSAWILYWHLFGRHYMPGCQTSPHSRDQKDAKICGPCRCKPVPDLIFLLFIAKYGGSWMPLYNSLAARSVYSLSLIRFCSGRFFFLFSRACILYKIRYLVVPY